MADENIHYVNEDYGGSQYTTESVGAVTYYDECEWKTVTKTSSKSPGDSEDETTLKQP